MKFVHEFLDNLYSLDNLVAYIVKNLSVIVSLIR